MLGFVVFCVVALLAISNLQNAGVACGEEDAMSITFECHASLGVRAVDSFLSGF